ncbi:MAG: hypothetical protein ACI9US_004016 [Gammaproteobacteria bacterium]|jgi:hypothetical protein
MSVMGIRVKPLSEFGQSYLIANIYNARTMSSDVRYDPPVSNGVCRSAGIIFKKHITSVCRDILGDSNT